MARKHKDWLASYLKYTQFSEAPTLFHYWNGVSAIASALQRCVWFDQFYFKWYPNFYIIFVAPAGIAGKSSNTGVAMELLKEIEGIHIGASTGSWQGLLQDMQNAQESILMSDGHYYPQAALTCFPSELGSFISPGDRQQRDILTELWDGGDYFSKKTLSNGEEGVEGPCLNLVTGVTPSWMLENLDKTFYGAGLASRIMFLYANAKRQFVAYPKKLAGMAPEEFKTSLVSDLQEISELRGPMELTQEAEDWGVQWYEAHAATLANPPMPKLAGYYARKQTHLHKLAMIISASRRNDLVIEKDDMEEALARLEDAEKSMNRIYRSIDVDPRMSIAAEMYDKIKKEGELSKSALYRTFEHQLTSENFDTLINSLVAAKRIELEQRGGSLYVVHKKTNGAKDEEPGT